jgi:hypothetical protein
MSLGGFWDALQGANGLGGQIWAFSLIAAVASGMPLLLYLSKRIRSRAKIKMPRDEATPKEESQQAPSLHLHQAVRRLDDELMPVLRQEAQRLDDLEKENKKLRTLSGTRKSPEKKRAVKRGVVTAERPIRRKSEM